MILMPPRVYLASSSPQRYRLLKALGISCVAIDPDIDETPRTDELPVDYVMRLAVQKSNNVAEKSVVDLENSVIIGSDTCVAIRNHKLGKPASEVNAGQMLELLSGQVHQVFSAVAVVHGRNTRCVATVSDVEFYPLSESKIQSYLASGEANNRAGAYAIQGEAGRFVKRLTGSLSSVIGMPVKETIELLQLTGVVVSKHDVAAQCVHQEFAIEHEWSGNFYI